MAYNPDIHHRRSIRLCDYDYGAAGFYFVTICVHERRALFGTIIDGIMHLNDAGRMVEDEYHRLSDHYPHIKCHEYVIMPNHFHAIIQITDGVVGAGSACPEMGIQPVCKQGGQIGQADPAPTRHTLGKSLDISNIKLPNASIYPPAYGNVIITNTSFVTNVRMMRLLPIFLKPLALLQRYIIRAVGQG